MTAQRRLLVLILAGPGVAGVLAVLGAAAMIRSAAAGRTYRQVTDIPHRRVGLVLGCARQLGDGRDNLFFRYRIAAATELYQAGKVDYLLVSGDNHRHGYDEATDLKDSLVAAGVPADRVYCDYAGFRTFDSVVRAKAVFGQTNLTVISQEFHNQRAIYVARQQGIDAIGYNARDVDARASFRTRCREQLARVKTLLDVHLLRTQPKFLGTGITIGPAAPPATLPPPG